MSEPPDRLRIDKWLWAARFFKTRSLAAQAVDGGRVQLNGARVKPAKDIRRGDELAIHIGELEWVIAVQAIPVRRGPAEEARELYAEREESRARRQALVEARKLSPEPARGLRGRPTKRDRRMMRRLTGERG
ncbi:MAG TPA: RNA-binding S4 domain-containing protein [Burkholderiales bacterium]|nr:RNA-binding S4 domain-containing protein [Burkholderiales bacterium]